MSKIQRRDAGPRPNIWLIRIARLFLLLYACSLAGCVNSPFKRISTGDLNKIEPGPYDPTELRTLLRDSSSGGLLLRREGKAVVEWMNDGAGGRVRTSSEAHWNSSPGMVQDCRETDPHPNLQREPGEGLLWKKRPIPDLDRRVMRTSVSNGRSIVAVFYYSRLVPGFFLFGPEYIGPYFVQLVNADTGQFLGPKVKLPLPNGEAPYKHCWSPGDRFLLILGPVLQSMVVISPDQLHEKK